MIQGGLKRTADLPNVPLMQELVDDEKTKKIIEFISAGSAIGRALITPPAVPADRLAALREAFDKLVKDPEFIADAAKRSADLEPTPGATVQTYSDGIASAPKDVIEAALARSRRRRTRSRLRSCPACSAKSGTLARQPRPTRVLAGPGASLQRSEYL